MNDDVSPEVLAEAQRRTREQWDAEEDRPIGSKAKMAAVMDRVAEIDAERGPLPDDPPPDPAAEVEARWARFAPPRFRHASLEALTDMPAQSFEELSSWCASPTTNLVLLGPVGTGKTFTGFAVCRHLLECARDVAWWPTVELLDALRPGGELVIDRPARAEFLFLDDLGGEKPTDWVAERLYLILNRRWLDGRPTIVSTNLAPGELRVSVGARAYDRLRDQAVTVQFAGASRRGSRAS
jgi:DNA replication protein DnaC